MGDAWDSIDSVYMKRGNWSRSPDADISALPTPVKPSAAQRAAARVVGVEIKIAAIGAVRKKDGIANVWQLVVASYRG